MATTRGLGLGRMSNANSVRSVVVGGVLFATLAASLTLVSPPGEAQAAGRKELVGAKLIKTVKPATGFVDDPIALDEAGGRLAYVNASIGGRTELRVLDLAQGGAQLLAVDIGSFTKVPERVSFVLDGDRFLVVAKDTKGQRIAALVSSKKIERRFGPATDIRVRTHQGKQVVVLYTKAWVSKKKGPPEVRHTVELRDLKRGKRVGKRRTLVADETGRVAKLDFRISYWTNDFTRAIGIKGGAWDRAEDQRTPDLEAWYEMTTGTFSKKLAIGDLMAYTKRNKVLSAHSNEPTFVTVAQDLSGIILVKNATPSNAAAPVKIALTEPFSHYIYTSLVMQPVGADGTIFFSLVIDPVHPDAAARRRAVPKYLDLYELALGAKTAKRRARILLKDRRKRRWVASSENWIVVPAHIGFDRGGKRLQIYGIK